MARDGTAEPVSRHQVLRHGRGQGKEYVSCSAEHEQDWQPYPVDPYSAESADHRYIHNIPCIYIKCLSIFNFDFSPRVINSLRNSAPVGIRRPSTPKSYFSY